MSLDVTIYYPVCIATDTNGKKVIENVTFWEGNITHNLGEMANYVGVYTALWRPEELYKGKYIKTSDIGPHLELALQVMQDKPDECKQYNNEWRGTYEWLLEFIKSYLNACNTYNRCYVKVSR